jgi:tRNA-dihydrouridine synthase
MFEGRAAWQHIELLKKSLAVPVIGSGDLFCAGDIIDMLQQTGCDGIMAARGALGNPWIFREALALQRGEELPAVLPGERCAAALKHLHLFVAESGERIAVREMRKHLCWYARGLNGAARFRAQVNKTENLADMEEAVNRFFLHEQYEP